MSDAATYKNYLTDLGPLILERALEAKQMKQREVRGTEAYEYASGRLMAYNEVISIMQQQAGGFNIPLAELKLEKVDPDRDLL